MRRTLWMWALLCLAVSQALAQDYRAATIPPELKKSADVVLRSLEENLVVMNIGEAVYREKSVYTILNEEGFGNAIFYELYDKLSKLKNIKIVLFHQK